MSSLVGLRQGSITAVQSFSEYVLEWDRGRVRERERMRIFLKLFKNMHTVALPMLFQQMSFHSYCCEVLQSSQNGGENPIQHKNKNFMEIHEHKMPAADHFRTFLESLSNPYISFYYSHKKTAIMSRPTLKTVSVNSYSSGVFYAEEFYAALIKLSSWMES